MPAKSSQEQKTKQKPKVGAEHVKDDDSTRAQVDAADLAFSSYFFWAQVSVVKEVAAVTEFLSLWSEGAGSFCF